MTPFQGVYASSILATRTKKFMYNPIKPFKHKILREIEKTWQVPGMRVARGLYPLILKEPSGTKVDHTDGLGTKGFYHWQAGTFRSAVLDALAMNLNDLAMVRARAYKLQNHITVPVEDVRVFKILQALVDECRKWKIAITGGENSFHHNLDGLDLSISMTGIVESNKKNRIKSGDVLIALRSSGLHSNGFTKVRQVLGDRVRKEFVIPTAIYSSAILGVCKRYQVNGMMHITGGAFAKLHDIASGCDLDIDLTRYKTHQIFNDLFAKIRDDRVMYTTFNCGVGFIMTCPASEADRVIKFLRKSDVRGSIIGESCKGSGLVSVRSAFTGNIVKV